MMETEGAKIHGPHRRRKRRLLIALPCAALLALVLIWRFWPRPDLLYRMAILPSPAGTDAVPYAINDRGQVAGYLRLANGTCDLFVWDRDNGMRALGSLLPVFGQVEINNAGQIVGTLRDPNGQRAFLWDPDSGRRLLPTLGGRDAQARAINDLGQVVGVSDTVSGARHAFVWDAVNGIRDLTPSGPDDMSPVSINNTGRIILRGGGGPSLLSADGGGVPTRLGASFSFAFDISNSGHAVCLSPSAKGKADVVVWHPNSPARKVARLKATSAELARINDANQVLIWQRARSGPVLFGWILFATAAQNYLWDPHKGLIALDACVSIERGSELHIADLNNHGCLVGLMRDRNGCSHAVVLEPIPERWEE